MNFNLDDIHANNLEDMDKLDARELLSHLESSGYLHDYIAENYPKYISDDGEVMRFNIITDFKLW